MSDRLSHLSATATVIYDVRIDVRQEAHRKMVQSIFRTKIRQTLSALGITHDGGDILPYLTAEQAAYIERLTRSLVDGLHRGLLRERELFGSCTYLPDAHVTAALPLAA